MTTTTLTDLEFSAFLMALADLDPGLSTEDLLAEAEAGAPKIAAIRALAERASQQPDAPVDLHDALFGAPVRSLAAAYASEILTDDTIAFYGRVVERRLVV